ncbi:HmuY family protein [Leptospira ognonensis]|nr:HmuY family protein [Leptospira ognonensis]
MDTQSLLKKMIRICKYLLLILFFSFVGCARERGSVSEQTQLANQYALQILRAADPNTLDKIVYSRADTEGTTLTRINATNLDFYIYFNFQTNSQVPQSLASSTSWDIAFNRYKISTNSGSTNASGFGGACLSNSNTVSIAASNSQNNQNCMADKFTIDGRSTTQGVGGAVGDFIGNSLLTDWFNYEIGNLTTKGNVYIVRSGTGNSYYAVKMESYYSEAGTSGYPTIRWKKLP